MAHGPLLMAHAVASFETWAMDPRSRSYDPWVGHHGHVDRCLFFIDVAQVLVHRITTAVVMFASVQRNSSVGVHPNAFPAICSDQCSPQPSLSYCLWTWVCSCVKFIGRTLVNFLFYTLREEIPGFRRLLAGNCQNYFSMSAQTPFLMKTEMFRHLLWFTTAILCTFQTFVVFPKI